MEEELWYMQHQSRILQEFRINISGLWDDEAARTLNRNLFNPHQEDDELMVREYTSQHTQITGAKAACESALERAQVAEGLCRKAVELIERVDEDIERTIQYLQQYRNFYAESKGLFPDIETALAYANKIGNGAPAS